VITYADEPRAAALSWQLTMPTR